jgi:LEA14-like dessication related protein
MFDSFIRAQRNVLRRSAAVGALACCVLVAGCAALAPRPLPPKVQVDSVTTVVGPTGDIAFRVRLDVQNPNAYDVAIRSIDAQIRVEDQPIATASLPAPAVLTASASTRVDVEARPDFNALAAAFDRILRRLALRYEVTGYAVVQDTRVDFAKRGELPIGDFLGRVR